MSEQEVNEKGDKLLMQINIEKSTQKQQKGEYKMDENAEKELLVQQQKCTAKGKGLLDFLISEANNKLLPKGQKVGRKLDSFELSNLYDKIGGLDGDWCVNLNGIYNQGSNSMLFYLVGSGEKKYLHFNISLHNFDDDNFLCNLNVDIISAPDDIFYDRGQLLVMAELKII